MSRPPKDSTFSFIPIEAPNRTPGVAVIRCSVCGEVICESINHRFKTAICTKCQTPEENRAKEEEYIDVPMVIEKVKDLVIPERLRTKKWKKKK